MHFAVVLDLLIASRLDFRPILQGEDVGGVLQVVLFDQNTLEGFRIEAECRTALETLVIGVHVDILEILVLVIGGHICGLRYRRPQMCPPITSTRISRISTCTPMTRVSRAVRHSASIRKPSRVFWSKRT